MLDKLSDFLLNMMEKDGEIEPECREAYEYGLKIMIVNIAGVLISLIIGILMSAIIETVVFLLSFAFTRRFTGGYHADKFYKCTLTTGTLVLVSNILTKNMSLPWWSCLIISLISLFVFIRYAPIENENKPLSGRLKRRCKNISIVLLFSQCFVGVALLIFNSKIYKTIFISLLFVSLLILISILKERSKNNEKGIKDAR